MNAFRRTVAALAIATSLGLVAAGCSSAPHVINRATDSPAAAPIVQPSDGTGTSSVESLPEVDACGIMHGSGLESLVTPPKHGAYTEYPIPSVGHGSLGGSGCLYGNAEMSYADLNVFLASSGSDMNGKSFDDIKMHSGYGEGVYADGEPTRTHFKLGINDGWLIAPHDQGGYYTDLIYKVGDYVVNVSFLDAQSRQAMMSVVLGTDAAITTGTVRS